MDNHNDRRCVFPLTSLQIGDLQSYLSHLSLFLPPESGKFYLLVDNRPWLQDLVSMSTHWWQLMVTKSRLSPFANTRGKKDTDSNDVSEEEGESRSFGDWFSLTCAMLQSREKALLPVQKLRDSLIANSKLHRTLYGFIVFEISWNNVRGINYLNELQTDTSFAVEAKVMRRWEFDSVAQAACSISSWFPGTIDEQILLKEHLDEVGEIYHDAHESFPLSEINITPSPSNKPLKRIYFDSEIGICSGEDDEGSVEVLLQTTHEDDSNEKHEPTLYQNVLIIIRFNDLILPFKLKEIIMSKLRLLTLLEAGLPSWVIFLQSYPGFCRLYRHWMCPLARGVYVLISVITVLIGFYDLYKNVPLLKRALSNVFGPLFNWVEEWEMISRIKYLGTMLFLHNFQKAIRGVLMLTRSVVMFITLFLRPMAVPFFEFLDMFFPLWTMFVSFGDSFFSIIWMVVESSFTMVGDFLEILLFPLSYILIPAWNFASSFVFVLLYAPYQLLLVLYNLVSFMGTSVYSLFDGIWISARSVSQVTRGVNTTVKSVEVSMWRSLWKDLFSQLFKALRSILHGFVAFFAACNRHRLSIYNHVVEFGRRLLRATRNDQVGQTLERGKSPQQHMKTA